MDKKIILSVLIVALIGIVAATYQINSGEDILNPLASVETEESPVTEVLTAPETADDAQAQADAQAKAEAQKAAQAQQEADAKAKAQQGAQAQDNSQSQSVQAGQTSPSASLVNAENGVTVPTTSSSNGASQGSSDSNGASQGSSDSNGASNGNAGAADNSGSSGNGQTGGNAAPSTGTNPSSDSSQNTNQSGGSNAPSSDTPSATGSLSDEVKQQIQQVVSANYDSSILRLDWDAAELQDGSYVIPAYYVENGTYAGKFYIPQNDFSQWKYVASDLTVYSQQTPTPGLPENGVLDTE